MEYVNNIKSLAFNHFKEIFQEPILWHPRLDRMEFKRLSSEESIGLEVPFSLQDIKELVWNSEGDKSSNTYGLSMEFFKGFWNIISQDLFYCVNDFF